MWVLPVTKVPQSRRPSQVVRSRRPSKVPQSRCPSQVVRSRRPSPQQSRLPCSMRRSRQTRRTRLLLAHPNSACEIRANLLLYSLLTRTDRLHHPRRQNRRGQLRHATPEAAGAAPNAGALVAPKPRALVAPKPAAPVAPKAPKPPVAARVLPNAGALLAAAGAPKPPLLVPKAGAAKPPLLVPARAMHVVASLVTPRT